MDPSLLQPSRQQEPPDEKPSSLGGHPSSSSTGQNHGTNGLSPEETDHHSDYDSQDDENPSTSTGPDGAKRPRLRLAHACDRCRKRKIRCDTHHPCGPCQATKNECTFHTPSRRPPKPKNHNGDGARSSSTAGFKRPHSPVKDQTALEARLAALEAMLRDVPPNVHNAVLSRLDARLGSGTGVGIKEGKGEGVNVALEALGGGGSLDFGLGASTGSVNTQWLQGGNAVGSSSRSGFGNQFGHGSNTANTDWSGLSGLTGGWAGGRTLAKKREEEGVDAMAKRMEGMSFFYEDEIGQAKWQGASSRKSSSKVKT